VRVIAIRMLAAALLCVDMHVAGAQAPTCTGKNILDEMQASEPEAYARILAKAAATENANALLWKIERAGKPASHLFGTMHLTDARIHALSPALKDALAGARRLVLEVEDLSSGSFTKAFAQARGLMMFAGGRRLEQLLSAAEFENVSSILERAGLPAQLAGTFRPWVASLMLAMSDCERQRMTSGLPPLDKRLATDAQALGIPVAGLETLELQFRAMAGVPEADQIELLKAGVRLYDRINDMIETTIQLYLARQLGAIWPLQLVLAERVGVAAKSFDTAERDLLVTRNLGMRDKAGVHLEEGGALIAVGALHLPGKQGLVQLLRETGYTLTPIE
jgi:uncharacterized protein